MPASSNDVRAVGRELAGAGDVGRGAGEVVLAPGERGRKIPGEGIGRDELERMIDLGARRGEIAERDLGAAAVEMDLAAQLLAEARAEQGRVEIGHRLGAVAVREPGIGGLDPEIGATRVVRGFRLARGLLEGGGGRRPALQRRQSEAEALPRRQPAALYAPGIGGVDRGFGVGADLVGAGAVARGERGLDGNAPRLRRGGRGGDARPPRRHRIGRGGQGGGLHRGQREEDHSDSIRVETVATSNARSDSRDRR